MASNGTEQAHVRPQLGKLFLLHTPKQNRDRTRYRRRYVITAFANGAFCTSDLIASRPRLRSGPIVRTVKASVRLTKEAANIHCDTEKTPLFSSSPEILKSPAL